MKIKLISKKSSAVFNIAQNEPNDGYFSWRAQAGSSDYEYVLKIEGMGQNADYSDTKDVIVCDPIIEITSPKKGEVWHRSAPAHNITWTKWGMPESVFGSQVRIQLSIHYETYSWGPVEKSRATSTPLNVVTPNDGEYTYTKLHEVPADVFTWLGTKYIAITVQSLDGSVLGSAAINVTE